ncbi:MAG: response regulator [Magnetococcales bacterium]|nr:response regulator [Magnetococcales bacterium]
MKILIADDEAHNRVLLQGVLEPYGACDQAVNGREAVDAVRFALEDGTPYDLICLDIMMPELDGQDALAEIREMEREHGLGGAHQTPIFMISALDTEEQVVRAFFQGGCTDYITKPASREKVLTKLREHRVIE